MIVHEMESFVELANLEERVIFQNYINKCKLCYGTVMGCITFTMCAMLLGPFALDQTFPLEIKYPFDVERQPLKTIIYLHHALLIYQSYVQVCTNVFVALLLWFLVARFDILACKFRKIANASEFLICVKQHQQLLRYARNVTISLRFVTLAAIIATTIAVILASLTFLSKQPITVKIQFMTMAFSALMEVFLCAWPADCLIHMSSNISQAAYDSMWFDRKVSLHKDLLYITARSQQPVILSIPCVLPILSLNFYSSFLSSTFSFLTAFRAVLEVEVES
ncbi:odorant receptor 4-like [Odontomachus brunneus]|uniref:odorant receptor 4-like n=1 Tax=Odontomachus brunneus TaxID=486640 RepID=UPI0013F2302E|nr:odorant receptor 4-like [Odontomachus brunneus]